jgi:GxxExxY protein
MGYLHADETDQIICSFYNVYNGLGYGFLEKVYENALCHELSAVGVSVVQQAPVKVEYKGRVVGNYVCDLLVSGKIVVELKSTKMLLPEHDAQLLNYLKATDNHVGLLLNFGPKPQVKRRIF